MLWVKGKVTAAKLVEYVFIPSVVCLVVPLLIASFLPVFKGKIDTSNSEEGITYKSEYARAFYRIYRYYFCSYFQINHSFASLYRNALCFGYNVVYF